MRLIIQRVKEAKVEVDTKVIGEIKTGFLILIGVEDADNKEDVEWLAKKVSTLRIFNDENGHMNLALNVVDGDVLVVSQFTLHASTKKGNRPSFIKAAQPTHAEELYELFKLQLSALIGKNVESGKFGADMQVSLINDGPVTIFIDSKNRE